MSLLLIILLVILLAGGGFGYRRYGAGGAIRRQRHSGVGETPLQIQRNLRSRLCHRPALPLLAPAL